MTTTFFTRTLKSILPAWLKGSNAVNLVEAIGEQFDELADSAAQAVHLRFPNFRPTSNKWDDGHTWDEAGLVWDGAVGESLKYIGRDRKIRRGRRESDSAFGTRILPWWDEHKQRGNVPALLRQLHGYYGDSPFEITCVSRNGTRHVIDAAGDITRDVIEFEPDLTPNLWSRLWLFYAQPPGVTDDGIWDDPGYWDDGGTWDSNLTVAEVDEIRTVPRDWLAAHIAQVQLVLLVESSLFWDYPPGQVWDGPGLVWGDADEGAAIVIQVQ